MLKGLGCSMYPSGDSFQFAYKTIESTLGAVTFCIHKICKFLDSSMQAVRCSFLDYSSAFYLVSRSLLLHTLEAFSCPRFLLARLFDYFTKGT